MPLLDLPTEILNHILWYLDLEDLYSCQVVHKTLHTVIKDSILLTYLVTLKVSGMEDNRLHVRTPTAERLNILRRQETAWSRLEFCLGHAMQPKTNMPWLARLDNGNLFLLDHHQTNINYIDLLASGPASSNNQWNCLHIESGVLDFNSAVAEHDLIAIVTKAHDRSISTEIEILLLQVSTGLPHPRAERSRITIENTSWQSRIISVGVSGDNLVILVNDFATASADKVFFYTWMSGMLKTTIAARHHSYSSILFLSSDKILLPNRTSNSFDIWNIPDSVQPTTPRTVPEIVLEFLPFREDTILMGLSCSSSPSPAPYGIPRSSRPFYESPTNAIIYIRAHIQSFHVSPLEDPIFLSIIVHRPSLLEFCAAASDGNRVPWNVWGPKSTRLLGSDVFPDQWHSATLGERFIALKGKSEILVFDFNLARARAFEARENSDMNAGESDLRVLTEKKISQFAHGSLVEVVFSELPYTYYARTNIGPFDSILVDGQTLLGLRMNNLGQTITEIEVMHLEESRSEDTTN